MTHSLISLLSILLIFFSCLSGQKNGNAASGNSDMPSNKLIIKIGSNTFIATLQKNATVTAFKSVLSLTVQITELNGKGSMVIGDDRGKGKTA